LTFALPSTSTYLSTNSPSKEEKEILYISPTLFKMVFIFHRISNYHFKNEPKKKKQKQVVFNREFFIEA